MLKYVNQCKRNDQLPPEAVTIKMNFGGLGDMIARCPAIAYFLDENPHLNPINIYVHQYFLELGPNLLSEYDSRITWHDISNYDVTADFTATCIDFAPLGHSSYRTNLTRHAFNMLVNKEVDEKYMEYPMLKLVPVKERKGPYVCITTNYTAPVRRLPAETVEGIAEYIHKSGYEVVLLGRKEIPFMHNRGRQRTECIKADEVNFNFNVPVTDLRDKTTLLEAGTIIAKSRLLIGPDSGLMHLGACTPAPMLIAFTSVDPNHRKIYRGYRSPIAAVGPSENVTCRYCQSNMGFTTKLRYKYCRYDDYKCVNDFTFGKLKPVIDVLLKQ